MFGGFVGANVNHIGGYNVHSINGDDFGLVGKVHHFSEGDCNAQAGKAAWTDGNIDLLDLFGPAFEPCEELQNRWEEFLAVSQRSREGRFSEDVGALGEGDRANSA